MMTNESNLRRKAQKFCQVMGLRKLHRSFKAILKICFFGIANKYN